MTEKELRIIRRSFVRATEDCCPETACLLTVMKYYGVTEEAKEISGWCSEQEGKPTLGGMKEAAIRAGMKASLYILDLKILQELKEPLILFTNNFEEKPSYSVCYGLHEGRYIIYEPEGGPMQYEPEELERRWIEGICMTLTVTMEFLTKAPFELRWWWPSEPKPKPWKERVEAYLDWLWLYVLPLFRWRR